MKRITLSLIFFLLLSVNISAIRINEIELNPLEGKEGIEWVELYNEGSENVDISGWEIYDGLVSEKKRFTIADGTIINSENYYIIEFDNPILNNGGDYVIVYDSSRNKIDQTETRKETSSGSETWQYCDSGWVFSKATKNSENDCVEEQEQKNQSQNNQTNTSQNPPYDNSSITESEEIKEKSKETTNNEQEIQNLASNQQIPKSNKKLEVIKLNTQIIKSKDDNKNLNKNTYAMYGFAVFCMLIGVLFILKSKNNKNEFG
ncbi:MAG: lamin tail domain-containing protein [Nanoarchaeota archaeon]|nr:lamin tail domain-containing protein [Nanoarchaeota archaeon]MBU1028391.1 lamin tail domain-containing protein [Nanoarchaeota archaeon]